MSWYIQEYIVHPNIPVRTNIRTNSNEESKYGFLILENGHSSSGDKTGIALYLLKTGYDGEYVNVTKISEIDTAGTSGSTEFSTGGGYVWITNKHPVAKRYTIFGAF